MIIIRRRMIIMIIRLAAETHPVPGRLLGPAAARRVHADLAGGRSNPLRL